MKKSNLTILIFILLVIIAVIIYFTNKSGTLKKELRDFAVEDTASVDKIFMVNKANQQVTLERNGNDWMVNGKFIARRDAINVLLKTLNRIDVKSPVSKSSFDNVVKNLAAQSTKVEVYQNKNFVKTIYVGGPTQDNYGTYMMLENSATPFIIHIPGFSGYLSTRFFIEESLWRATNVFNFKFQDISEIIVEQPVKPENGFKITSNNNHYEIIPIDKNIQKIDFDTNSVKEYISRFKNVNFEYLARDIKQSKKDSVLASVPYFIISVKDINGKTNTIKTFLRPGDGLIDDDGKPYEFDPDRLYGLLDNGDFVIIQYYVFDPLFRTYKEFYSTRQKV
ncbi:MAG: hypothetical protein A2033_05855 [Bacteroidetes bacterium GWA2_31_9]|nr:MAG: hypothetical protein A2033_05855 [Bacteroidetes bacterium GWA2_31_9]